MTLRTLLVSANGTKESQTLLESAFKSAQQIGAHLTVMHVRTDPRETIPLLGEGMSVGMIDDMTQLAEEEGNKRVAKAREQFEDCVSKFSAVETEHPSASGYSTTWKEVSGREDEMVAQYGRMVDLILVSRPDANTEVGHTLVLNAALFDTGRPALVVPPNGISGSEGIGKKIVISWNGSPQSARAVSSALPLLKNADDVSVFTIESSTTPAVASAGMTDYMAYHGVNASLHTLTGSGTSVGEALLKEVKSLGADMVVMGAYTHSRMRQLILGGVTRHVLEEATVPLFMAH